MHALIQVYNCVKVRIRAPNDGSRNYNSVKTGEMFFSDSCSRSSIAFVSFVLGRIPVAGVAPSAGLGQQSPRLFACIAVY